LLNALKDVMGLIVHLNVTAMELVVILQVVVVIVHRFNFLFKNF